MKLILVLTIVCVIAAFLLGLTYNLTAEKIKYQEEMAEKRALKSVLLEAADFSKKISGKEIEFYKGLDSGGEVIGYAFIGEGKGYSSIIKIMIGVDMQNNIKGINVITQQETPGLGTKVGEPRFQEQFAKKSIDKVDTITGATISSRAVRDIVKAAIGKFKKETSSSPMI